MVQSDTRITMYLITTLRHTAGRKASQYRNHKKKEILLLDAPTHGSNSEDERTWGEFIPIDEEGIEEKVTRNTFVKQILLSLTPREREVVVETFILEHTEAQVAQRLGIRQQRVSQLKKHALLRMREECKRQGIIA
ncbi:MAG: sigma-70 family RNA polymerase sigma factor [Dehalobacterium sp.]